MPAKKPKTGGDGVIVHFGHGVTDNRKGTSVRMHVLHVEPPKTVAQETDLVAKIKKLSNGKPLTPVLFTASLLRSGGGHSPKTASLVGGESSSVGKLCGILKLLKRLIKRFCESPHVYFSLDMPSTCSCWNWPELHALLGSKGFKVKAAECADATGRLTGRRCVIFSFLGSKRVEDKFSSCAERKVSCKLSDCIREAWASVALHVRGESHYSPCLGNQRMHESDHGHHGQQHVGESTEACRVRSQRRHN